MRQVSPVLVIPCTPSSAMVDVLGNAFAYVTRCRETVAMMSLDESVCVWRSKACHTGDCAGPTGPARDMPGYALTSAGFQMLILRVSGITKMAMMKHTAGTKIG